VFEAFCTVQTGKVVSFSIEIVFFLYIDGYLCLFVSKSVKLSNVIAVDEHCLEQNHPFLRVTIRQYTLPYSVDICGHIEVIKFSFYFSASLFARLGRFRLICSMTIGNQF